MSIRKVCVVTGGRAEYGLLRWLMQEIADDPELRLQVIATGTHLSPEFGLTHRIIEADGFVLDAKVEMLLSSDTPSGICKSLGLGVMGISDAFERLQPDIVVLLGDRFEALAAAQAALIHRLVVAHIHGGEATFGATDEAIRHAITKMAQLHFVAAEPYRRRVVQLGENPRRVFDLGPIGLDNLSRLTLLSRDELWDAVGIEPTERLFLVTYHPVTLDKEGPERAVAEMLASLEQFPDATILFTQPNADVEGRMISEMITRWAKTSQGDVKIVMSLGQVRYLSALMHSDVVIGNSSSGLLEAPSVGTPTVNIGSRQAGRLRAPSVIDVAEERGAIEEGIRRALSRGHLVDFKPPHSLPATADVSRQIKDTLKTTSLDGLLVKEFFDLGS